MSRLMLSEVAESLGIPTYNLSAIIDANGVPTENHGRVRLLDTESVDLLRPLVEAFKARRLGRSKSATPSTRHKQPA